MFDEDKINEGIRIIIYNLGNYKIGEKLCIITDKNNLEVGRLFFEFSRKNNINVKYLVINELKIHGEEPPKNVVDNMNNSNLIIGLTKFSMAHSKARIMAENKGNRYLSLADYSKRNLIDDSLRENFLKKGKISKEFAKKLTNSHTIKIMSKKGTNLIIDTTNRKGNNAPGYVNNEILLGSPPDIEANIAPIENNSNGVIVIDGSIPYPGIGLIKKSISLEISNGKIISIKGDEIIQTKLNKIFHEYGEKSTILSELGVGFNKKAKLCGNMLIDEGVYQTIHLGFGSNIALGGENKIGFHLDFVLYQQNLIIDNESIRI
jgi:2,5-dihydroxypyridine 5,6-dioxygenase